MCIVFGENGDSLRFDHIDRTERSNKRAIVGLLVDKMMLSGFILAQKEPIYNHFLDQNHFVFILYNSTAIIHS